MCYNLVFHNLGVFYCYGKPSIFETFLALSRDYSVVFLQRKKTFHENAGGI